MKQHISSISTKVSRAIYVIKRAKHFLPQNALKTLYTSIVQNHLQYGTIAWGNGTNVKQLLILKKRAVRIITNKQYRAHTDPLFNTEPTQTHCSIQSPHRPIVQTKYNPEN